MDSHPNKQMAECVPPEIQQQNEEPPAKTPRVEADQQLNDATFIIKVSESESEMWKKMADSLTDWIESGANSAIKPFETLSDYANIQIPKSGTLRKNVDNRVTHDGSTGAPAPKERQVDNPRPSITYENGQVILKLRGLPPSVIEHVHAQFTQNARHLTILSKEVDRRTAAEQEAQNLKNQLELANEKIKNDATALNDLKNENERLEKDLQKTKEKLQKALTEQKKFDEKSDALEN